MNQKQAERNLKLFYVFEAFREPLFWGAILITFIQKVSGMSLADIFFMESVCVFVMIFLEIPAGSLADLLGRKKTIFWGLALELSCLIIFALATNPLHIWISNILCFAGISLIHGADTSLLYDTLKFLDRENQDFKKIKGRATSGLLALCAVSNLASGYLAKINIRLPIYLALASFSISLITSVFFTEPPLSQTEKFNLKKHWDLMKLSVLFVANHKKVKWLISFTVLIGTASKIWFFTYNPYFEMVNLPLRYFGWLFFFMGLIAAAGSFWASWLAKKLGSRASIIAMISLIALPILLMGSIVNIWMVLLVLIQNIVRGYIEPFTDHFLHDYLDSQNRATVFSIRSTVRGLSDAIFLFIFSWLLNNIGLPLGLQILGVTTLTIGILLIIKYQSIFAVQKI
ncbi:MAG: MFS transporter [Candidatus Parcubacteria bacterium]|nr:MFS transporter [Candidatus Parcubacteria bacterium]